MDQITVKVHDFIRHNEELFVPDPTYHLKHLRHAPELAQVLHDVKEAWSGGVGPQPLHHAYTESFFLLNKWNRPLAVFKPFHELDHADSLRECLAYRLDEERFACVPPTTMTTLTHPTLRGTRTGSCQLFIPDAQPLGHLAPFDLVQVDPAQFRRLAMLDIRLLNPDRHSYNVIVSGHQIFPVDHGAILPHHELYVEPFWIKCPEVMTEATKEEIAYLERLALEKQLEIMRLDYGISTQACHRFRVAHYVLLIGIERGWKIGEIGQLLVPRKGERWPGISQIFAATHERDELGEIKEIIHTQMQEIESCV